MTTGPVGSRLSRMVRIAVPASIGIALLAVFPDLYRLLPERVRQYWPEQLALALVSAYGLAVHLTREGRRAGGPARRAWDWLDRIDAVDEPTLWRWTARAAGLLCAGFLVAWVPHYLTWPWSRDEDTFAVLAQSWDRGILPYRDIRAHNFPGETYLFWALGKVFGWGRTIPFYALDACCVVALGVVLIGWSRRRLGGAAPGAIGYLGFLWFYLSQPFQTTGERDWQTAWLVCLSLLALQAWPGRWSRIASAMAAALALSIRPHAVLFLPALASAVGESRPRPGPGEGGRERVVLEWSLWLAGCLGVLLAPLLAAGILDDVIRGLRVAGYGGPYSRWTPSVALEAFLRQFLDWRTDVPMAATFLLAIDPRGRSCGIARTWSWAWLGALLYRAIHPVQHLYLVYPVRLVGAITWALPIAHLISARWLARPVRLIAVVLLAYELAPGPPFMCGALASAEALWALARGESSPDTPPGCSQAYPSNRTSGRWTRYGDVLAYLRQATGPDTLVANVLNRYPYDALNGPTGRLSPFRVESGICWLSWVDLDLDPEFARDLERATDSVVVWEPAQENVDPKMKLERVVAVVRWLYEPEARFGEIEVWRRRPSRARTDSALRMSFKASPVSALPGRRAVPRDRQRSAVR